MFVVIFLKFLLHLLFNMGAHTFVCIYMPLQEVAEDI